MAALHANYICHHQAPETGGYIFSIAGDDQCEFWLSTDETPTNAKYLIGIAANTWTNPNQFNKCVFLLFLILFS